MDEALIKKVLPHNVEAEKSVIGSMLMDMDAVTAALNGGDDYKFLFIIPISEHERFHKEFPNVDIIGHLCAKEAGAALVTPEGAAIEMRSL